MCLVKKDMEMEQEEEDVITRYLQRGKKKKKRWLRDNYKEGSKSVGGEGNNV